VGTSSGTKPRESHNAWPSILVGGLLAILSAVIGGLIGANAAVEAVEKQMTSDNQQRFLERRAATYLALFGAATDLTTAWRSYSNVYPLQNPDKDYTNMYLLPAQQQVTEKTDDFMKALGAVEAFGSDASGVIANDMLKCVSDLQIGNRHGPYGSYAPLDSSEMETFKMCLFDGSYNLAAIAEAETGNGWMRRHGGQS